MQECAKQEGEIKGCDSFPFAILVGKDRIYGGGNEDCK